MIQYFLAVFVKLRLTGTESGCMFKRVTQISPLGKKPLEKVIFNPSLGNIFKPAVVTVCRSLFPLPPGAVETTCKRPGRVGVVLFLLVRKLNSCVKLIG